MKIDLMDKYVLTTDPYNFILNEKAIIQTGKNRGKEVLNAIGFWPTLTQLLDGLIDQKMLKSNARTLEGLVREHTALIADCRRLLGTLKESK